MSILRWVRNSMRRAPSLPMRFPTTGFEVISDSVTLGEERFEDFKSYYPVNIGDVFDSKYQVVGKLGFGISSTVWLARDLQAHQHVTLKVYKRGEDNQEELEVYKQLSKGNSSHPGYCHVRTVLNSFIIDSHQGDARHHCLVQKPMWDSFRDLLFRNPTHRFTEDLLKSGLIQIFRALDYLHTECKLVHTDIKADNILLEIADKSILDAFTKAEMKSPSPRKFISGAPVYASRQFERPRSTGGVVLSDFGSAVRGDIKADNDVQPNIYRSPEVMLKAEWSYPIDIWNVGAMVWDLFEGKHMFYGHDSIRGKYMTRSHLAEVIGLLGMPPLDLLQRGKRSHEFFTLEGQWKAEVNVPRDTSLEQSEEYLEGKNKEEFLNFMKGMLQWRPEDRKTAKQLLEDPWLKQVLE